MGRGAWPGRRALAAGCFLRGHPVLLLAPVRHARLDSAEAAQGAGDLPKSPAARQRGRPGGQGIGRQHCRWCCPRGSRRSSRAQLGRVTPAQRSSGVAGEQRSAHAGRLAAGNFTQSFFFFFPVVSVRLHNLNPKPRPRNGRTRAELGSALGAPLLWWPEGLAHSRLSGP